MERSHVSRVGADLAHDEHVGILLRHLAVVDQYLQRQERGYGQLVDLEQSPPDVVEDGEGDAVNQDLAPGRKLRISLLGKGGGLLALLDLDLLDLLLHLIDAPVEYGLEGVEGIDVVGVDLDQVVHHEEEQRGPVADVTVLLGSDQDVGLSGLGYGTLLLDIKRDPLGLLESLDELDVLGDVTLGRGKLGQDVVLELLDLYGEAVLLLDQFLT
mmetsp:Transcript_14419/g.26593  ORF Transcript_14419/g.26593 Transcript_14419/m.26593 type:complete len:213 (-) Transcript_14419:5183-5821(-)